MIEKGSSLFRQTQPYKQASLHTHGASVSNTENDAISPPSQNFLFFSVREEEGEKGNPLRERSRSRDQKVVEMTKGKDG